MKNLGTFCLVKNEGMFIRPHLDSWLPYVGHMVFYDGNSTDGTLGIIRKYQSQYPDKITLVEDKDPKDLEEDYVRLSNEAMWAVRTPLAAFVHPDMILTTPGHIPDDCVAGIMNLKSFAGNPGEEVYEIKGRGGKWKNIYRLRNPNLGAHYYGDYGAQNEDTYFTEITGNEHIHHGQNFGAYPYPVTETGIAVSHYSDIRPYSRRLDRMIKCLKHQGYSPKEAAEVAPLHPRVSLKDGQGFRFLKVETPAFLREIKKPEVK